MTDSEPKESQFDSLNLTDSDPSAIIGEILPRGHSFHGYSSASGERVFKILGTPIYDDDEPMLGFGVDSDAEVALGRAIATYLQRESDGLTEMSATQYPDLTEGWSGSNGHASKFDNIVWGGDFTLSQDGDEVVARSSFGGGWGMEPLVVRAETALDAITHLAARYRFVSSSQEIRDQLGRLPALSWSQSAARETPAVQS